MVGRSNGCDAMGKIANQVYVIYGRNSQTLALGGYPTAIDPPVAVILFVQ